MCTKAELPRYRSHKTVWALKIAGIEFRRDGSAVIAPCEAEYAPITTKPDYRSKFKGSEDVTGYYVRYQDGYESWSPTKAFDDGYTLITTGGE